MAHMRTRIALLLTSLIGIALVQAPAATAAGPEGWVKYNGTPATYATVLTHGFGHGIGLSQWGAEYRAQAGQSVDEILSFYFPGTTRGVSNGLVRVWITADADHNTIVRPAKGLAVTDLGTAKSYLLPTKDGAIAWRLTYSAGKNRVAWLKSGIWHDYKPGGKVLTGSGEFRSTGHLLTLYVAGADHVYRGAMRLVGGRTINVLALENYLKGVVPVEAYTTWKPEALKSQAVAARTYAAFERNENLARSYQICDTSQCQVYRGYSAEVASTTAAVAATSGRVVLYGGKLAFTQFSASNGGITAKPGTPTPYLVGGRPDTYDKYPVSTPRLGPVTKAKLEKAYPELGSLLRFRVLERDTDGRVLRVELDGTKPGTVRLKGTTFRSLMGIRSTYFSFQA
jgi:stage II sporulation protein D